MHSYVELVKDAAMADLTGRPAASTPAPATAQTPTPIVMQGIRTPPALPGSLQGPPTPADVCDTLDTEVQDGDV